MKIKLAFLILLISSFCKAQYYETGQDPSNVKWEQINTANFQIIFPRSFENEAQRLANILNQVYPYATKTLQHKPKRISVILHNQSSVSNAFVTWAPKRVEFFTIPPQDVYPQDWLEQLAIHEFRHVVQIDKLNQGITKILTYIFGQQATGAVLGLFMPLWFVEGDAVVTETALSNAGRGRLPGFEMLLRTQVLGTKIYSYEKAYFGSYKDFVPDYYVLGYHLVGIGRNKYGHALWEKAIDNVARQPYSLIPFSLGIRKTTGGFKYQFYRESLQDLDSLWRTKQSENYPEVHTENSVKKTVYTNYRFPQFINDTLIVAEKTGLSHIKQYVGLKKGKEEKVFIPGFTTQVWLSAKNDLISWAELNYDERWSNRIFSDILVCDIKTKKRKRITHNKHFFSPALSKDASKIVAVEIAKTNEYSLVILETKTGKELYRIVHPQKYFFLTPTWSQNEQEIISIILTEEGKSIVSYNLESREFKVIYRSYFAEISQPVLLGNYLFFHGTYGGRDNIFSLDLNSNRVYQVTNSEYGAFDPAIAPDERKMAYSNYTPMGYNVVTMPIDTKTWKPLETIEDKSLKLYDNFSAIETRPVFDSSFSKQVVKKYRKGTHLFNFHSWAPLYIDVNNSALNSGLSLLSQNKLSTAITQLGYKYNYNERVGSFEGRFTYKGWFPQLDFTTSIGNRAGVRTVNNILQRYTWTEKNIGLGITIPFNLTKGKYVSGLSPSLYYNFREVTHNAGTDPKLISGYLNILQYQFFAYRTLKTAPRDLNPKFGQVLQINYNQSLPVAGSNSYAPQIAVLGRIYFPGFIKHHSIKLSGGYQKQETGKYHFQNILAYPRGYFLVINDRLYKASFDYKFPLFYPDLKIGPVAYFKRVNLNLFCDYANGKTKYIHDYISTGFELTTDVHLCNFIAPFNIGFRYDYLPLTSQSRMEVLLNINLNSF